jgi:outer membrane biosynthesis protein TonB
MDTAMPLQLLQPLDGNNPASTPVHLTGPEQRLIVTPDPGVGDESLLPPSQLLIVKDGESRSIWPVHLAGWQALGWQLYTEPPEAAPEPEPEPPSEPEPEPQPAPELEPEPEPGAEPAPLAESSTAELSELPRPESVEPATATDVTVTSDGEALLASQPTDFQAMTKAQIVDYCSAVHGVELDSSQTKAELVEQATALEAQANDTAAADLAALELGDVLL